VAGSAIKISTVFSAVDRRATVTTALGAAQGKV